MATVTRAYLQVQDAGAQRDLANAANGSGEEYERTLGGCIVRRHIPILEMVEDQEGIPIVGNSFERTRGKKSSQSQAWMQWKRGHRQGADIRWPEATIEFLGPGGVVRSVYALEITKQNDVTKIGESLICQMSMAKAGQIVMTPAVMANKPHYRSAAIKYWYLCPWDPSDETITRMLTPLGNLNGTANVAFTWFTIDHGS